MRHLLPLATVPETAYRLFPGQVVTIEALGKFIDTQWGANSANSKLVPRKCYSLTVQGQIVHDFFVFDKGDLWTQPT